MTIPHVDTLAGALLDDEADTLVVYEALKPFMDWDTFVALGAALEVCPVHLCDIQICLDDNVHGNEVYD